MNLRRAAAIGGAVGPAAFVTAWVVGSAIAERYSAIDDPISRLAALHAPTRPLMSAGFVAFGVGVGTRAAAASGAERLCLAVAAAGVVGVCLTPLDSGTDGLHAAFAGSSYVALTALPLTSSRRAVAVAFAAVIGASLFASTLESPPTGLFQRLGLTVADVWIVSRSLRTTR